MGDHRRDVAGSEDPRVGGRPQGFVDGNETSGGERQPGLREPSGGTRLGHPQRLVEGDPLAVRADQRTPLDTENLAVGQQRDAALGKDLRKAPADAPIV